MTLTKADMVAKVYAQGLLTKSEAANSVETSLELIKDALANSEEVLISGFGKWSVRAKSQRRGRNPQTGDPLTLPSRKVVTFRPSRVLKTKIQGEFDGEAPEFEDQGSVQDQDGEEDSKNRVLRPGYF